jgi:hypothetical protein
MFFLLFSAPASAKILDTPVEAFATKLVIGVKVKNLMGESMDDVPLNQLVNLIVTLKSTSGLLPKDLKIIKFNATMPKHQHGMVTKPRLTKITAEEYLIEGVKLHMPGAWQFNVHLELGNDSAQVAIPLKL